MNDRIVVAKLTKSRMIGMKETKRNNQKKHINIENNC